MQPIESVDGRGRMSSDGSFNQPMTDPGYGPTPGIGPATPTVTTTPGATYPVQGYATYPSAPNTSSGDSQYWPVRGGRKPSRSKAGRTLVAVGIVAVVVGGGAFGMNAYAKNVVCSALKDDNGPIAAADADDNTSAASDAAGMREVGDKMRNYSRMLVIDQSLSSAVSGLAEDVDQLADLREQADSDDMGFEAFGQMITLAGSINTHARQAQRACGLPVTGIPND